MPIEFLCPSCQQQLRVPDTAAGKNAKCPKCSTILTVPGSSASDSPLAPPPQAGFDFSAPKPAPPPANNPSSGSFAASAPTNPFGDSPKEGNPFAFDASRYPTTQSTMAAPQSSSTSSGAPNPYASPQGGYHLQRVATPGQLGHQIVEVNPVVNHAIEVWKANLGIAIAKTLLPIVIMMPVMGLLFGAVVLSAALDEPALTVVAMVLAYVVMIFVQTWIQIGQVQMSLKIARGQPVAIGDMFRGGERLLPVLGFGLLLAPVMVLSVFMLHVPLILFLLYCWPSYYLIVDGKCGILESFKLSLQITEGNKLVSFVLALVTYGFIGMGYMVCLVGVVAAIPLISILWSTAYLMMSGQMPMPPRPQPQPYYPPQPHPPTGYPPQPQGYLPPPKK